MEYTKTVWKDLPDTSTPITADKLNNIEDGVEYLFENGTGGGGDNLPVGTEVDFDGTSQDIPTGWESVTNPDSYSTSEVKTNMTWIDGKPIYRKVVQINGLPNNTETTYQTGIINGETIKYDGFLSLSESDLGLQHMPYFSPYSSTGNVYYWVRKDTTYIHIKTGTDRSSSSAYIIIEYTKTTD